MTVRFPDCHNGALTESCRPPANHNTFRCSHTACRHHRTRRTSGVQEFSTTTAPGQALFVPVPLNSCCGLFCWCWWRIFFLRDVSALHSEQRFDGALRSHRTPRNSPRRFRLIIVARPGSIRSELQLAVFHAPAMLDTKRGEVAFGG
jgi:hypothetical protein